MLFPLSLHFVSSKVHTNIFDLVKDVRRRARGQRLDGRVPPCDRAKWHADSSSGLVILDFIADAQRSGGPHASPLQHAADVRLLAKDRPSTGIVSDAGSVLRPSTCRTVSSLLELSTVNVIPVGRMYDS